MYLAENPEIEAVLITSPTYDGIVSNVAKIAEVAHHYGVPLIVDEAHRAHFRFSDYFSGVCGAACGCGDQQRT